MRLYSSHRASIRTALVTIVGVIGAWIILTQAASVFHSAHWNSPSYCGWRAAGYYCLTYRAAVNHGHGWGQDPWEVYVDQYGTDPSGGPFDQMYVQGWQGIKYNCGAWQIVSYNEAYRFGVTQNWAYTGSQREPDGACTPKRRAQMVGHFWDGPDYFSDQAILDD